MSSITDTDSTPQPGEPKGPARRESFRAVQLRILTSAPACRDVFMEHNFLLGGLHDGSNVARKMLEQAGRELENEVDAAAAAYADKFQQSDRFGEVGHRHKIMMLRKLELAVARAYRFHYVCEQVALIREEGPKPAA